MRLKVIAPLFSLALVLFASNALASFETYYPKSFRASAKVQAKQKLLVIIQTNHRYLDYATARKYLFGQLHLRSDKGRHYIEDVYCQKTFTRDAGVGPMRIPNHNVLNCEHTWPQSRFNPSHSKKLQKSDLHHLYPSDNRANSTRGNHPFGDVRGGTLSHCESSRIGDVGGARGMYFDPPARHRGNVARALFYFATRYSLPISAVQEDFLRQWHDEDPVDQAERRRNNAIEEIQGNRNPFIDFPEMVNQISDF